MAKNNIIRYGRCMNAECSNYGISDIIPEDGKCPNCGRDMIPDEDDSSTIKEPKRWPKIIAVAFVGMALLGGIAYGTYKYFTRPSLPLQDPIPLQEIEQNQTQPPIIETPKAEPLPTPEKSFTYSGDMENGKPHGRGTITYNTRCRIDPRDEKERFAEEGDYIVGEFENGKLVHGVWFDKNNIQKGVIIIGK